MKKIFILLAFIVLPTVNAQAPQGFNYQATVRNSAGALIINQNVLFKFNIMLNSQTSLPMYSETHQVPTDDLGQVNLTVGTGTATTGTFTGINWETGTYYLGIELNTGTGYVAMGTTQLLSVPYALYANSAGSTSGNSGGFSHYVGELFGGGIIFNIYKDSTGAEHGLILALTDQSSGATWSNVIDSAVGPTAQSSWDGLANSNAIVAQAGHVNSAAKLCLDYVDGSFDDWYLPSILEFNTLMANLFVINKTLSTTSGATLIQERIYHTSTESDGGYDGFTTNVNFESEAYNNRSRPYRGKDTINYIRAIRRF
jgi:hypothetical protein